MPRLELKFKEVSAGEYAMYVPETDMCVAYYPQSANPATPLRLETYVGTNEQKWQITPFLDTTVDFAYGYEIWGVNTLTRGGATFDTTDTFSAGRYDDLLLNTPAATGSFEITIPQGMVLKSVKIKGLDWWDRYTVKLTSAGNGSVSTGERQSTQWETFNTNWMNPSETVEVEVENLDGSAHWFGVWKVSFLTFTYGPPN